MKKSADEAYIKEHSNSPEGLLVEMVVFDEGHKYRWAFRKAHEFMLKRSLYDKEYEAENDRFILGQVDGLMDLLNSFMENGN